MRISKYLQSEGDLENLKVILPEGIQSNVDLEDNYAIFINFEN